MDLDHLVLCPELGEAVDHGLVEMVLQRQRLERRDAGVVILDFELEAIRRGEAFRQLEFLGDFEGVAVGVLRECR